MYTELNVTKLLYEKCAIYMGSHEGAVVSITHTGILQIEVKVLFYYVDKYLQRIAHKTTSCLRVL
jgi:hypothetical protein